MRPHTLRTVLSYKVPTHSKLTGWMMAKTMDELLRRLSAYLWARSAQVFHTALTPVGNSWRRRSHPVTCARTTSTLPALVAGSFWVNRKKKK